MCPCAPACPRVRASALIRVRGAPPQDSCPLAAGARTRHPPPRRSGEVRGRCCGGWDRLRGGAVAQRAWRAHRPRDVAEGDTAAAAASAAVALPPALPPSPPASAPPSPSPPQQERARRGRAAGAGESGVGGPAPAEASSPLAPGGAEAGQGRVPWPRSTRSGGLAAEGRVPASPRPLLIPPAPRGGLCFTGEGGGSAAGHGRRCGGSPRGKGRGAGGEQPPAVSAALGALGRVTETCGPPSRAVKATGKRAYSPARFCLPILGKPR